METAPRLTTARLGTLLALTASVYGIELAVVHGVGAAMPASCLAAAVTFGLVVAVPLFWWFVALRGTRSGIRRVLSLVVASLAGAALVVPRDGRALVSLVRLAVVPLEIGVLVVTVRAVMGAMRLGRTGADVAERLDEALTGALGDNVVAHVLAAEASAVLFAVVGGSRGGGESPGRVFTAYDARVPAFTWGLALAIVVETFVMHLLVGAAHPRVAWALTGLGAYALVWVVGQHRAVGARAIALEEEHLVLRAGLRLTARVPWSLVQGADAVSSAMAPARRGAGDLDVARPAEPNVVVRLREPVIGTGAFGVRRRVARVAMCVDEPERLVTAITARSAPGP